mmetsp:Transcript_29241/g.95296  ORF Transcript_29241/g.95296 Transcript_29241/m.95296 type:complete len:82 (+) Transcript_29241:48-293(+)
MALLFPALVPKVLEDLTLPADEEAALNAAERALEEHWAALRDANSTTALIGKQANVPGEEPDADDEDAEEVEDESEVEDFE